MRTIHTSDMSVVLVLLAAVAATAFNIFVARTLSILVALEAFRTTSVTVALFATLRRKTVLVGLATVAAETGNKIMLS